MNRLPPFLEIVLILLCMVTAITDISDRKIPNWAVCIAALCGVWGNAYWYGIAGFINSILGFLCAFVIYILLYLLQGRGAGDLKLMAAIGAITGFPNWFYLWIITAVLGGVLVIGYLLLRGGLVRAVKNAFFIIFELIRFRSPSLSRPELAISNAQAVTIPHALVVAISTFVYLWLTHLPVKR